MTDDLTSHTSGPRRVAAGPLVSKVRLQMIRSVFAKVMILGVANLGGVLCAQKTSKPASHRAEMISVLKTGVDGPHVFFNEDTIAKVSRDLESGDSEMLTALLMASIHCDGAASEMLGMTLGNRLLKAPLQILRATSVLSTDVQKAAGISAISADGAGWSAKQMKQIRNTLIKYSKSNDKQIATTSILWLGILNEFEKANRE